MPIVPTVTAANVNRLLPKHDDLFVDLAGSGRFDEAAIVLSVLPPGARLSGSQWLTSVLEGAGRAAGEPGLFERVKPLVATLVSRGESLAAPHDRVLPTDAFLEAASSADEVYDEDSYAISLHSEASQALVRDVVIDALGRGATSSGLLVTAARMHAALLVEALVERDRPKADATYGKAKNNLLHEVLGRDGHSGEHTARLVRFLVGYGVSLDQKNAKGQSPRDVWEKTRRKLRPAWRKTVESALPGAGAGGAKANRKGAPLFACPGMHIAALGALRELGLVEVDFKKLLKGLKQADFDSEDDLLSEALSRVHQVAIDRKAAAKVEALWFDGGAKVYLDLERALRVDSGGESDVYRLASIAGVEHMAGLTSLSLSGYGWDDTALDLAPLAGHGALARLSLQDRKVTHAEALDSVASLEELAGAKHVGKAVLARLRKRGVKVVA